MDESDQTDKQEVLNCLDDAIRMVEEMKSFAESGEEDSPLAFFEAGQDAIDIINRALHLALSPLLRLKN